MKWNYKQPVEIRFGSSLVSEIGSILAEEELSSGLLVCDSFFTTDGTADRIVAASDGRICAVFSDIVPNPTVKNVDECAAAIRKNCCNFVVAMGGGSAIDCSKAACSIATSDIPATEYLHGRAKIGTEHLPMIVIPTTAGTGSEVTPVSVLSDPETGTKAPIAHNNFYAKLAIVDPELTLTVPPRVTAATGLDVLSHALEAYWSVNHQPICDAIAVHAADLVFRYLLPAYHDGNNLEYREKLCEASIMAGLAFGLPKTTASHACSFPLTSVYGICHGEACAFTLDSFVRINASAENGRVEQLAKKLGFESADKMADKILAIKKETGMATTLTEAGIPEQDINQLAEKSMHPNILNNPVKMDIPSLVKLYRSLA